MNRMYQVEWQRENGKREFYSGIKAESTEQAIEKIKKMVTYPARDFKATFQCEVRW